MMPVRRTAPDHTPDLIRDWETRQAELDKPNWKDTVANTLFVVAVFGLILFTACLGGPR